MDFDIRAAQTNSAQKMATANGSPIVVSAGPATPVSASLPPTVPVSASPAPAPKPVVVPAPLPHEVVAAADIKPGDALPEGIALDPVTDKVEVKPPNMPRTIEHIKDTAMHALNNNVDSSLLHPVALWLLGGLWAYILARFHLSFAWIILSVPVFLIGFKVIVARKVRAGIRNEYLKLRYQFWPDKESVEWINHVMWLVWHNYGVYISEEVMKQAKIALAEPPKGLRDIGLTKFDLGSQPPQLRNFKVYRKDPQQLLWDLELFWDGDFDIRAFVTPSISPVKMHVKVADLFLSTKIRLEANLLPNTYPFAKTVALQMLEDPKIDISVSMLGASVTDIPGFATLVRTIIVTVVKQILCPPNRFEIDLLDVLGEDPAQIKEKLKEAQEKKTLLKEGGGIISGSLSGISSMAGGIVGGVGAIGGAAVGGVGKVGGAAMDGVGAIGKFGSSGAHKLGNFMHLSKEKEEEVAETVAAIGEATAVGIVAAEKEVHEKKKLSSLFHKKH